MSEFQAFSTTKLIQRLKLSNVAIYVVCIGASIGILTSSLSFFFSGEFATTTAIMSLIALLASRLVVREKRQIKLVLSQRP